MLAVQLRLPHRSARAIQAKARNLKLTSSARGARPWTRTEDDRLRRQYQQAGARLLADELQRSRQAIYNRVVQLGIARDRRRAAPGDRP